ncbi:MAG: LysR family transcriptional regulator [Myxococcaceae bacterium]|nr:LysR family transcriptional regulator [Myxococcaceae bacterium]
MDLLRTMGAFREVARRGGFSAAAQALRVSNATVTAQVQQLEAHLGVALFHRTTRRVTLTTDGAAALARVERLLEDVDELQEDVRGRTRAARGRVRVDVPAAFGRHILAPALPSFFSKHPHVQLELGSSDRPVDLFREGIDCVVRGGPVFDDSLIARRLKTLPIVTLASPSYLRRAGTPKTPDDCRAHRAVNFFSPRSGEVFAFDFERDGQVLEVPIPHAVACNDSDTLLACGVAGLGLLQAPRSAQVDALIAQRKLVQVLPAWTCGALPVAVLYPPTRHLSARVRAFVDWLVSAGV